MNKRDIIIIAHDSWDAAKSDSIKYLALEFAKNNRVLYVNLPQKRSDALFGKQLKKSETHVKAQKNEVRELWQATESIWVLKPQTILENIDWIGIDSVFEFMNKTNAQRLARRVKMAMLRLNFQDAIVINDSEMYEGVYLTDYLHSALNVYYLRERYHAETYLNKHCKKCEVAAIEKSDLVIANTVSLAQDATKYNANSFYVGQGHQFFHFDSSMLEESHMIQGSNSMPVIGVAGNLSTSFIDLQLLITLAVARPEWTFLFVGNQDFELKSSRLKHLRNVKFVETSDEGLLSAYVNDFDVCLYPVVNSEITNNHYPSIIDAYFELGKPVVATAIKPMDIFDNECYLAESAIEFIKFIQYALFNDSPIDQQKRKNVAKSHSWGNTMNAINDAIYATSIHIDVA